MSESGFPTKGVAATVLVVAALGAVALVIAGPTAPGARPAVRASYAYSYVGVDHIDSLAAHGFTRLLVHTPAESVDARTRAEFGALRKRADARGIEFVPEWLLQSPPRLAARPAARRYTWNGHVESQVACPLDSAYWQSALIDRAEEFLAALPGVTRLAFDLEVYRCGRHHYDGGACQCAACLGEYTAGVPELQGRDPSQLGGLAKWEEDRVQRFLVPMLQGFAQRHPGVRLEVLDLDLDSFVHRALARALLVTGIPTADYAERTYATGAASLADARTRLDKLGLEDTPLIGGLWLQRWTPAALSDAIRALGAGSQGVWFFTTFSLWLDPAKLTGPYTLQGTPADYWAAVDRGFAP